jgi:hypothetical protein
MEAPRGGDGGDITEELIDPGSFLNEGSSRRVFTGDERSN